MQSRPFVDPDDIEPTLAWLATLHAEGAAGGLPTASRLRTLLLSRLWRPGRDARIWPDARGRPCGFAGIFPPEESGTYLPLTVVARAESQPTIATAALGWAEASARAHAAAIGREVSLCITIDSGSPLDGAALASHGYAHTAAGDVVHLARSLRDLPPVPALPPGFHLGAMPRPTELERHADRYAPLPARRGLAQRRRLMAHPDYEPTLEFVALADDGTIAAWCEGALSRASWASTGRRSGEIDWIAAHPALRRRGLGRALLAIALHRLRAAGADTARLFTEASNTAARQLYRNLGFAPLGEGRCYARTVGPGA